MFAGRVEHAARRRGQIFRMSGDLPDEATQSIDKVIVDLSTRRKIVEGLMERVARVCPNAEVVAYGPHVQVESLKEARQAGIPRVMTRGQFDAWLGSW